MSGIHSAMKASIIIVALLVPMTAMGQAVPAQPPAPRIVCMGEGMDIAKFQCFDVTVPAPSTPPPSTTPPPQVPAPSSGTSG